MASRPKLKMNDDKTECMPIGTRQQLAKVFFDKITVGENSIPLSQIVKNLGTLMDCNLKFHKQINSLCKLDYCNSILYGLPAYRIAKLQTKTRITVQNTAARLVYMIPKFAHISPYLKELHWLNSGLNSKLLSYHFKHFMDWLLSTCVNWFE